MTPAVAQDPDAALLAALAYFDREAVTGLGDHDGLVLMHPRDFQRLAAPVARRIDAAGRRAVIGGLLKSGTPFNSLPWLELQVMDDGPTVSVEAHDGRHRAQMLNETVRLAAIPVVLSLQDELETGTLDRLLGPEAVVAPGLRAVTTLYPQAHDEDEDYPGLDEDDLEDRLQPVAMDDMLAAPGRFWHRDEVLALLDAAAQPALP